MVSSSIAIVVVMIIGVAVVLPILSSMTTDVENTTGGNISESSNITNMLFSIIPVVVAIAIIMLVVSLFGMGGGSSDEESDPETPEEIPDEHDRKKERIYAEELLRRRYVRGEITTEEYNERMANL